MRTNFGASMVIAFFFAGLLLSPPDMISQLVIGIIAALLCGIPLAILARGGFMKSASPSVHTLVAALACALAISLVACMQFMQRIAHAS